MLGAALQSVDALMVPSNVKLDVKERAVNRRLSQKDIAALHDGSNSMKQFADQFGQDIKVKDRTPEDVERIAKTYLIDMERNPENYVTMPYTIRDLMRRNAVRTKEQDAALEKIKELRNQLAKDEAAYRDGEPYDEDSEHFKEITKQLEKQQREIDVLETKLGSLDYFAATRMSDGEQYDPENPLHYVEADAITFANLQAQSNGLLRDNEARSIRNKRAEDLQSLVQLMSTNPSYTLAENALVAKAASKFAVVSDKSGRLKVASIANNNRNGVAVVSLDAADAIIRELRAGKNLKDAFLDGMQASADRAIKENSRKEGWQKFNQTEREETAQSLTVLYTDEEIDEAWGQTGYDIANPDELVEMLINDGLLPDRRNKLSNTQTNFEQAAIELNKACAGTPWCTGRDESYARQHIAGGDFYVYYKQGRPEVAVRMDGQDKIGEIRGNSLDQALNKEQQEIAKNFLKNSNFSEAGKYLTQFKLKQKAIEVAKSEATFTPEDLVNTDAVYNGKVDVSSLLNFRMIDGYLGRNDPTESVKKFFEDRLLKTIEAAYEDGHFIGARISIMSDGINEIKLNNKKYKPTLDQVKTVESISVYSTAGKNRFPNLENVNGLLVHGDANYNTELDLPKVKRIEVINAFGKDVDVAVIKLAPGAIIDLIREGQPNKPSHITVEGVSFVKSFSAGTGKNEKLFVKLPDAKYVGEHNEDVAVYAPNRVADKPPIEEMVERNAEEPRYARAQAKGFEDELNVASQVIAKPKTVGQQIKANLGLGFRTQYLDRLAPLHQVAKDMLEPLKGMQMMHYLLASDQRMSYVQQAVGNGVPQRVAYKRPDGRTEYIVESVGGANLANVVRTLAKAPGMNGEAANQLFTLYLLGKRADRVGYDKLNFSVDANSIKQSVRNIESNKALRDVFEEARTEYNKYNKDLMHFLKDTGVLPPSVADELAATNDYIPYYREQNGNAELVIGKEGVYKIGNLADQPQLRELIGGEDKILDFATSSVQNTSMIMDVGLRNLASKNAMYELVGLDLAHFLGKDTAAPNVVRFKDKGEEKFVRVDTDAVGIPADLLVKGMEGIPVNTSALVRVMGFASSAVRKGVMLNPLYPVKQILRDSVAAPLLAGADFAGPLGALRALGNSATKQKLEARAITGGQVYTGTNADLARILKDLMGGRMGLSQFVAKAEAISMEADAATRRAQYDSYIRQGFSQMESTVMALESMNFNKRGLSPSMHLATTMIPFFNSQLQSLDVLWRAASGQLPMSKRLDIQGKLLRRGSLVMATAVAYALMMQDDDAYKNARPDEKYGNFFIRIPGLDEPIRFPVPFEIGYILKGIPEAIVNTMASKHGGEEAMEAFKTIAIQTIPGGSSMLMPALVKPLIENATNYSFFGQRELETKREQKLLPQQRFRDKTSELAKELGAMAGYSPIKIDNLIRGYTGTMGLAAAQAVSFAMPEKLGPQEATKRLSDTPVIGSMFQPNDAGGIINATYDRMEHIIEVKRTYDDMIKKGETAEARAFLQENVNEIASASVAGNARTQLTKITQAMNAVKASNMSPDEKRATLDRLQKIRIKIADTMRGVLDKTAPQ
jgi:polyhydroxyalkanoate synthesis regulator phasin/ribosomal protein S19